MRRRTIGYDSPDSTRSTRNRRCLVRSSILGAESVREVTSHQVLFRPSLGGRRAHLRLAELSRPAHAGHVVSSGFDQPFVISHIILRPVCIFRHVVARLDRLTSRVCVCLVGIIHVIRLGMMLHAEGPSFRAMRVKVRSLVRREGVRVQDQAQSVPGGSGRVGPRRSARSSCMIDLQSGRAARCFRNRPSPTEYDFRRCSRKRFLARLKLRSGSDSVRWSLKGQGPMIERDLVAAR